jgi:hypothetical protein
VRSRRLSGDHQQTGMVTLEVSNLHWIAPAPEDVPDICAHGTVRFTVGRLTFDELAALDCTVSAAAMYLLRSLSESYESADREHLFPCCGFNLYESTDSDDVVIMGCPNGVYVDVLHDRDGFTVCRPHGPAERVSSDEWHSAVYAFADKVADFYRRSSPKRPHADDVPGWSRFLKEWQRRRGIPLVLSP